MHAHVTIRSRFAAWLRAYAEKDGRGYPDWAMRYLPIVRRWGGCKSWAGPVLEIGANANGLARFTATRVIAVDISLASLREARAAQGVLPVLADITALPLRASSAGKCVCMDTLEHLPDAQRPSALREIARVLARNGAAAIGFPSGSRAQLAERRVRRAYAQFTGGTIVWLEEHAEQPLPDPDALETVLRDALGTAHFVQRSGNTNVWLWTWMWRVLMCGWPGRGNSLFQALLRWAVPLLSRCHFRPCYRVMFWIEPRCLSEKGTP